MTAMSTQRVEFIGGPLDGEVRELDSRHRELRIPLYSRVSILDRDQTPSMLPALREGIYVRDRRDARLMRWWGER